MLYKEAVGQVLRELRREQKKSMRVVSEKAFMSLGYLCEVERGRKEVSSEFILQITRALDVSLSEVFKRVSILFEIQEIFVTDSLQKNSEMDLTNFR